MLRAPSRFASRSAASVSAVSPDCVMTTARVFGVTIAPSAQDVGGTRGEKRRFCDGGHIKDRDGGVDSLRIAIWNKAEKLAMDGGTYHWRIGNDTFVADWQTAGKNHIHMTVRAKKA